MPNLLAWRPDRIHRVWTATVVFPETELGR
jgi:hypothetical protein